MALIGPLRPLVTMGAHWANKSLVGPSRITEERGEGRDGPLVTLVQTSHFSSQGPN